MRDMIIEAALRIDPSLGLMKRAYYGGRYEDMKMYLSDTSYLTQQIRRYASEESLKTEFRKVNEGTYKSKETGNDVKWTTAFNQGNPKAVKDFKAWASKQVDSEEGEKGGGGYKMTEKVVQATNKVIETLSKKHESVLNAALGEETKRKMNSLLEKAGKSVDDIFSSSRSKPKTETQKAVADTMKAIGAGAKGVAGASRTLKYLKGIINAESNEDFKSLLDDTRKEFRDSLGGSEGGKIDKFMNSFVVKGSDDWASESSGTKLFAVTEAIEVAATSIATGVVMAGTAGALGGGAAAVAVAGGAGAAGGAAVAGAVALGMGACYLAATAIFGKEKVSKFYKKFALGTAAVSRGVFSDVINSVKGVAKGAKGVAKGVASKLTKQAAYLEIRYKYQTNPSFRRALMRELTRD